MKKRIALIAYNWAGHFSLALGYLKAYALKDEFIKENTDIEILNFDTELHDEHQVLYYLSQFQPHLVGFSCYCWNIKKTLETARLLKIIRPQTLIVLGGPEVWPAAKWYLENYPFIDIVVRGEGEVTFYKLLKTLIKKRPLVKVKGLSFRSKDQIVETPEREPLENLDEIPSPYLEGILVPQDKVTYLETYRGCPFHCAYCFEGKNIPKLRFFSKERVEGEIKFILSHPHIKSFHFVDSIFNLKKDRLQWLTEVIASCNRYGAEMRTVEIMAEFVDEETPRLLKRANVKSVETGPQTVNQDTIKKVNRYFDPQKFQKAIHLLEKEGIEVLTDLIIGLPGDNIFKFIYSIKTISSWKPSQMIFSILHVLPGTTLFENCKQYGLKFDPQAPHLVLETPDFPFPDLDKAVLMASSFASEYNLKANQ